MASDTNRNLYLKKLFQEQDKEFGKGFYWFLIEQNVC